MKLRMVRFRRPFCTPALVASLLLSLTGCDNASETHRQVRTSDSPDVACDRLAADPDDSQRKGPGVAVNDLELEQAIEVCVTAVEAQPDNIRLRFQLGRVLVAADHTNEALPFLQEAADKNYPAALAYIGDLQDTDEAAKQYYQRAAKQDYAPAIQALAEIEAAEKREAALAQANSDSPGRDPSQVLSRAEVAAADDRVAAVPGTAPQGGGEDYHFAGLIDRISRGEIAAVPDDELTRALIVSMWPVFNAHCGERNPFLFPKWMSYGGFIVGFKSLGVMAGDPSKTDFPSIKEGLRTKRATIFWEPGKDAVLLVNNGCHSPEFRQFIGNFDRIIALRSSKAPDRFDETAFSELMSETFRRHLGLRDPTLVRREGQLEKFASDANASCIRQYSDANFCRCMINGLQPMGLEDSEWIAVGSDFTALAGMASKYKNLSTTVRSCNT